MYLCISVFFHSFFRIWQLKILSHENRKIRLTKSPWENILDPRNAPDKSFWIHKIPKRKIFGPTKYPRKNILDPRTTIEKHFWTHEIPTRKHIGPTKYPRRHDGTRLTKTMMARNPQNLGHSSVHYWSASLDS